MAVTLTGVVKTWKLNGHTRKYATVTVTYAQAREAFSAVPFDAVRNKGEQRALSHSHVRKLKKAMESGQYTPTPAAASLHKEHAKKLAMQPVGDGTEQFSLDVDKDNPLPLTDANHRMAAIALLREAVERKHKDSTDPEAKKKYLMEVEDVLALPITCTLYLDGEPRRDFVNLQAGRPVDTSQVLSMKILQNPSGSASEVVAFRVAKVLLKQNCSPFKNLIRFDSRARLPLPIATLCAAGASDRATSLLGLADVGANKFDVARLARFITTTSSALEKGASELLKEGKPLTTLANSGTKGSATMLIGLAICLAHRVGAHPQPEREEDFLSDLVSAANETLNVSVNGNFSGPKKREWMRAFAAAFFAKDDVPKHCGLPVALLETLSVSAFGVPKLPKAPEPQSNTAAPTDVPNLVA